MSKLIVRCRCGHQVLGREVLRTQPCEKPSGAETIYVKYRCRRCKKIGESFIAYDQWSPDIFDVPHDEIGIEERDRLNASSAIGSGDVISWHRDLQRANTLSELWRPEPAKPESRRKIEKRGTKDAAPREGDNSTGDKPQGDKPSSRSRGGS